MDPMGASESSDKSKSPKSVGRWLTRLKGWVVTSEPSAQAFRQHQKHVFQSAGVSRSDPDASVKLQYAVSFFSFFFFFLFLLLLLPLPVVDK